MSDKFDADNESFASRWSRKKLEDKEFQSGPDFEAHEEQQSPSLEKTNSETEQNELDNLPDIDSLDGDADYTPFMKEGVPDKLKRLALRKLWASDPAFGVLDGLDDYAEDYTAIGMVAREIATRYKPGKGMVDPDEAREDTSEIAESGRDVENIEASKEKQDKEVGEEDQLESADEDIRRDEISEVAKSAAGSPVEVEEEAGETSNQLLDKEIKR